MSQSSGEPTWPASASSAADTGAPRLFSDREPYEEGLLKKATTQWEFGAWSALIALSPRELSLHPDRAQLALYRAAGHLQVGSLDEARQCLLQALEWGCARSRALRILAAGAYNSLGRAELSAGRADRAAGFFGRSLEMGSPHSDVALLARARAGEQVLQVNQMMSSKWYQRLGLPRPPLSADVPAAASPQADGAALAAWLEQFQKAFRERCPELGEVVLATTHLAAHGRDFHFVHVAGDYIPGTIATRKEFYESSFLEFLGQFHAPGELIIDVGGNIGNHAVYFAGVLGADVLAFEPVPANAICLEANARLNGLQDRICVAMVALGTAAGSCSFSLQISRNFGTFSAVRANLAEDQSFAVSAPVAVLDELVGAAAVSVIKIDVEGMELDVIGGARRTLARLKPIVAAECSSGVALAALESEMSALGYEMVEVMNATPTFVFVHRERRDHLRVLKDHMRRQAVQKAQRSKEFTP